MRALHACHSHVVAICAPASCALFQHAHDRESDRERERGRRWGASLGEKSGCAPLSCTKGLCVCSGGPPVERERKWGDCCCCLEVSRVLGCHVYTHPEGLSVEECCTSFLCLPLRMCMTYFCMCFCGRCELVFFLLFFCWYLDRASFFPGWDDLPSITSGISPTRRTEFPPLSCRMGGFLGQGCAS